MLCKDYTPHTYWYKKILNTFIILTVMRRVENWYFSENTRAKVKRVLNLLENGCLLCRQTVSIEKVNSYKMHTLCKKVMVDRLLAALNHQGNKEIARNAKSSKIDLFVNSNSQSVCYFKWIRGVTLMRIKHIQLTKFDTGNRYNIMFCE